MCKALNMILMKKNPEYHDSSNPDAPQYIHTPYNELLTNSIIWILELSDTHVTLPEWAPIDIQ
jgi:hypothetical protein